MRLILTAILVFVLLWVGIFSFQASRTMLKAGQAYFLFDWRRLFGEHQKYSRNAQQAAFWAAILSSCLLSAIALSISIGVLATVVLTFIAAFGSR